MAFTDRVVEFPGRITLTDSITSTVLGTYDSVRAEGTVTEEGTPLTADNLTTNIQALIDAALTTERAKRQKGIAKVKVSAKSTASKTVTFPTAFSTVPIVTITPVTTVPAARDVGVSATTTTGFTLYAYSTTAVNLKVNWKAEV